MKFLIYLFYLFPSIYKNMDVNTFKASVDTDIINKTEAHSISKEVIGNKFKDLSDLIPVQSTISSLRSLGVAQENSVYQTTENGGGNWVLDSTDQTSTDNTGTVIVTTSGQRLKRIFDGAVNLEWFGAKGDFDFTTNTGTDNSDAIEKAIAYCSRPVIKLPFQDNYFKYVQPDVVNYIYVPAGRYKITRQIKLNPYIRFEGCSSPNMITNEKVGSVFVASGISDYVFASATVRFSDGKVVPATFITGNDLDYGGYSYCSNAEFNRITFTTDPSKTQVPMGYIYLAGATHSKINNCRFIGSYFPLVINSSWNFEVKDNFFTPLVCGIVLTESITHGTVTQNEVNGNLALTSYSNNSLPFGFASNSGTFYAGKTAGLYQKSSNARIVYNVFEFGTYYGVISENAGGTIDNNYIEVLQTGGCAYAQTFSAYLNYVIGYTSIDDTGRLLDIRDFSRGTVTFTGLVTNFGSIGNINPTSDMKMYNFKNFDKVIPKGIKMADSYAANISGDLSNVLQIPVPKIFNLQENCPLSKDVNVAGEKLILGNGQIVETSINATARMLCFTKDITFQDLTINVNVDGFISPIVGDYKIIFNNCKINLVEGGLFTNQLAFPNEENTVKIVFNNCVLTATSSINLFTKLSTTNSKLNVEVYKYQSTFTNIVVTDGSNLTIKNKNF